jgi:hypothetical protein
MSARGLACLGLLLATLAADAATNETDLPQLSLTLIPPSPVTDQITLDIRGAVRNLKAQSRSFTVAVYLDEESPATRLHEEQCEVAPGNARGIAFRWPARGQAGHHRLLLTARSGGRALRAEQAIEILPSKVRSTGRLGGAWVDLYHHDEAEGKPFNDELAPVYELFQACFGVS